MLVAAITKAVADTIILPASTSGIIPLITTTGANIARKNRFQDPSRSPYLSAQFQWNMSHAQSSLTATVH
jgi:hypothetical protein